MEYIRDKLLNIDTGGIREWDFDEFHNNRYEPTPYAILDKLFDNYTLGAEDKVVDFGCGRGRAVFYINNRFGIEITGIEAHEKTYAEAVSNLVDYKQLMQDYIEADIELLHMNAQDYIIKDEQNKFYFFNPFSIEIFRSVVDNILNSYAQNPRDIDLIVYYPMPLYLQFLNRNTDFELVQEVDMQDDIDRKERVLIYRMYGEEKNRKLRSIFESKHRLYTLY